ncbi:Doa1 protein [Starmerella bacillaris]|uniref:Doa1 protein n=1 Tax=Starmerella bacillaris TaxID=1247836 RepID=A0AAV5RIX2_STABA|nr:Doa1 protein [Starmerella bacillaris]
MNNYIKVALDLTSHLRSVGCERSAQFIRFTNIMSMNVYSLSKRIAVHKDDVRAVAFVGDNAVVTTSRDGTAKLTQLSDLSSVTLIDGDVYLNSVAVSESQSTVFVGAHDGVIHGFDLVNMSQTYLLGHTANVSCLDASGETVASGSWDLSVRVWQSPESSIVLNKHTQNVWGVKFVSSSALLTCGADKTIVLWDLNSQSILKVFSGHTDAVRGLAVLSADLFASVSNDTTVRIWNFNTGECVHVMHGHTSFIYAIARINEQYLVTSGEDRTLRIWDYQNFQEVQTIVMPSISQWSLSVNSVGDIAVGSSDNSCHIFTVIPDRQASAEDLIAFQEAVKSSAISESEVDEYNVVDESVLNHPGNKEGQVVIVKDSNEKLVAHQYSGGSWIRVGEVVGKNQQSSSKKQEFDGKSYDYIFDVDIADGVPPLKLPYNNGDNPYLVAEQFISVNELPTSYLEQIVQFIITNSEAAQFSNAGSADTPKADEVSVAPRYTELPAVLRYSKLLTLKSFQQDPLIQALTKIYNRRGQEPELIPLIHSLPSSSDELLRKAISYYDIWGDNIDDLLPIYDLLRITIPTAIEVPYKLVWARLLAAVDTAIPKHTLLSIRALVNLTQREDFGSEKSNKGMLLECLKMVGGCSLPKSKTQAVALTTLFLNLSVLNYPDFEQQYIILARKCAALTSIDGEADYRFALAVGLRSYYGSDLELKSYKKEWLTKLNATTPIVGGGANFDRTAKIVTLVVPHLRA